MIRLAAFLGALAGIACGRHHQRREEHERTLAHGIRMYAMGAADTADALDPFPAQRVSQFYIDQVLNAREGRQ